MRLHKLLPLALIALLASCGPPQPKYATQYELIPPQSTMGRMCANNCLLAQQNAKQSCVMQKQSCQQMQALQDQNDRLQARQDYDRYVQERTQQGKEIKLRPENFVHDNHVECGSNKCEAQADQSFNICYGNCGGRVIPHTMCVANCNLMPQPGMVPNAQ